MEDVSDVFELCGVDIVRGRFGGWGGGGGAFLVGRGICFLPGLPPEVLLLTTLVGAAPLTLGADSR